MSWRNHKTHREETKAVKDALLKAGFTNVRVGHDRGTAWGWLLISCDNKPFAAGKEGLRRVGDLAEQPCQAKRLEVLRIAQAVTGRHGDYEGEILVD